VQPEIVQLAERPEWLAIVAAWIYDEWWTDIDGASVGTLTGLLQAHLVPDRIPLTLVASLDRRPIGTATLLAHDVGTEQWPELSPWLAAVYVVPEYRSRGVGGALVNAAVDRATALGVPTLYLLTNSREGLYVRLGWQVMHRNEEEVVMLKAASP
jgi:GNAT superfamily N-acetyltransferase